MQSTGIYHALLVLCLASGGCARLGFAPRQDAPDGAQHTVDMGELLHDAPAHGEQGRDAIPPAEHALDLHAPDSSLLPPGHAWSQYLGDSDNSLHQGVAIDGNGNVVVAGSYVGTNDFGGGPLTTVTGMYDVFIASYTAAGTLRWVKRFGDTIGDFGRAVAVDPSGNVIVTGTFSGSVDFGGGPLNSKGSADLFIASYSSTGAFRWAQRFGGPQGAATGSSIAVDASGNVAVTGGIQGNVDLGGGALSAADNNIFIASYSSTGAYRWAQSFGGSDQLHSFRVAVDGSNNVIITGGHWGSLDLGGGLLTSAGSYDIFIASYSSTGAFRWAKSIGGTGYDEGYGVAVDGSDNLVVTGRCDGQVDFGGGPVSTDSMFVASYDSSGALRWAKTFGGWGYGVSIDGSNNVLVTGQYTGTVNFGGGPLTAAGSSDIFVASYTSTGAFRWAESFGGTKMEHSFHIAAHSSGPAVVGFTEGSVDFGGGPLPYGHGDYLLKLAFP